MRNCLIDNNRKKPWVKLGNILPGQFFIVKGSPKHILYLKLNQGYYSFFAGLEFSGFAKEWDTDDGYPMVKQVELISGTSLVN